MIDARKKIDFGRSLRTEDKGRSEAITAHFEAQTDLFTQCPSCKMHLRGALHVMMQHKCAFTDLLGA